MKTLFRLDHYYQNSGTFAGFFASVDEIPYNLVALPEEPTHGTFTQVTEFTASDDLSEWDAWEAGDIVINYYFEEV